MIKSKTVFILGAGASCPYGYPTGAQLRRQICLDFKKQYLEWLKTNMDSASGREDRYEWIKHFIETFFKSNTKSIDLFLARNEHLADAGKYIITFKEGIVKGV